MINITVPISVTIKEYVNNDLMNGCIIITTPTAMSIDASISHAPLLNPKIPLMKALIYEPLQMLFHAIDAYEEEL